LLVLVLAASLAPSAPAAPRPESASCSLAGVWRFALDRADVGIAQAWFGRSLPDRIQLPGVLQAQGYGDEISTNTPWVLSLYDKNWFLRDEYKAYSQPGTVKVPFLSQPPRHYLGAAWYQRDIEIPTHWLGRRVELFLERTRWETRAWLDHRLLGTNNSLCVPHLFEAGVVGDGPDQIKPGSHRLTVRVDNRMLMNYRADAHAVSDSLGSTWNGIVGRIELRSTPQVWVEEVRVQPDAARKSIAVSAILKKISGQRFAGKISYTIEAGPGAAKLSVPARSRNFKTDAASLELALEQDWPLGEQAQWWDEFSTPLYLLRLTLRGEPADSWPAFEQELTVPFGLRDFKALGQEFIVNGRPTHLRGTHHGGDFPLTGYPPCDVGYWLELWRTCKDWGLNHVRFHSFCPPEAAFEAADQAGIYLQIEPGMWNEISPGTAIEKMLYAETERILKAYGNHPSFVLMSASNEAKGRWKEALPRWVNVFRQKDPRRLYTPDTGWSLIDEPGPVEGADFLAVHRIGPNLLRGATAWFGRDYARSLRGVNVPVVSHELGQWCAYPDHSVISKFSGYLRPGNYEIFRDSLANHGLLDQNRELARASGRFQFLCYKEEIEANLRTPGLAGFQLLDLHDYLGQGTALVGLLDPFWESKNYASAPEFRRFCSPTVPLARLARRVFTTADRFEAPVEIAHYGPVPLTHAAVRWQIVNPANAVVLSGRWPAQTIAHGRTALPGAITADLANLPTPHAYRLVVSIEPESRPPDDPGRSLVALASFQPFENDWKFWLYPSRLEVPTPAEILVTTSWSEAAARLAAGDKVLFLPQTADLDWTCPPLDTVPVFWNRLMNPGWSRMLGLWCQARHPALAQFPTDAHCDWQWTELLRRARAINLDPLPRHLQPMVAAIDDWSRNHKLGLLFECKVGAGRLLVCSLDIQSDEASKPVASQLRRSLLAYMAGPQFEPAVTLSPAEVQGFLFDTRIMRKLGARAQGGGADASALLDGDPNTFWSAGGGRRGGPERGHPHEITIQFPQPVTLEGVVLLNRQNDRDHLGDIRAYRLEGGDDGAAWREIAAGELASTWNPQRLKFGTSVTVRFLKLTALSGFGADTSAALAEFAVLYAGPPLPETPGGAPEYKRSRSTSTDVDEGTPP
jgi:hypothetical protein